MLAEAFPKRKPYLLYLLALFLLEDETGNFLRNSDTTLTKYTAFHSKITHT